MDLLVIDGRQLPPLVSSKIEQLGLDVDNTERSYRHQSIYILCRINNSVVGVARVIKKQTYIQQLPIEAAALVSSNQNIYRYLQALTPTITLRDTMLPACEIGGLRLDRSLNKKTTYHVLQKTMNGAAGIVFENNYKTAWVTCVPGLVGLYERFSFKPIGDIRYGSQRFSALFRYV